MRDIDVDILCQLIRYEPETGKLFWLERDVSFFHDEPNLTAAQRCKWWNGRFAGKEAFTAFGVYGCKTGRILGEVYYAHRVAWALHHGAWPTDNIDHKDGNRANNRIENLREASFAENMRNRKTPKHNSSGMIGVAFNKRMGKWQSSITINGSRRHLGTFKTFEEAKNARIAAQINYGAFHENHGRTV